MKQRFNPGRVAIAVLMVVVVGGVSSGCATKKYVRAQVTPVEEATRSLDSHLGESNQKIEGNTRQIEELGSVTREHSQQITSLDEKNQRVDEKSQLALRTGESAQTTANTAVTQVSSLEEKFLNRNQYTVLAEERVQFPFDSARIEESYRGVLDGVAQRLKENSDAVLVMEGRTDSIGSDEYNIRLSEKRLEAVLRYLIVEREVPMHKVYKMGFGKARPIASNDTKAGRVQNRAVVLQILGPRSGASQGTVVSNAEPQP